ncbi:MAG: GldG family protein [Armatimonadetes bacterium]|nr:GldG family protein [Armatimonadota bacterium]
MSSTRMHHIELSGRDRVGIALGWASLVLLLAGLIWWAGESVLSRWNWLVLGAGAASAVAYLILRKGAVADTLPRLLQNLNTGAFILLLLAILGFVNYIAMRHYGQLDLTKQRLYSLSPQTKEVLKGLKGEVELTGFYQLAGRSASEGFRARDLMRQYHDASKQVKFEIIDPVADPARATAKAGGSVYSQQLWVESGGRKETVYTLGEQELTSAILKATRPQKKKVYFLFGHGERDIESSEQGGMGPARSGLEDFNYETSKLVLRTVKEIPKDAAVIVVAGPKNGIPDDDQEKLAKYLEAGGKMLLMADPLTPVPEKLVKPWGVEVGNNLVYDPRDPRGFAIVEKFEFHQMTKDLQVAYFPIARSVEAAATPPAGVTVEPLAKSSGVSWGETKLSGGATIQRDAADKNGPLGLAVVVTKGSASDTPEQTGEAKKSTRLVVVGDSDFATAPFISVMGTDGPLFFFNIINWLAEEEALVSIPPKTPENNQVFLGASQSRFILITTVFIIPIGVLLSGVLVWWRRR